jgi:esterase
MSGETVLLHYREYGEPARPPLLLLHGLFGANGNWQGVVKQLHSQFRLILPDLRNHGRSPHHEVMDYPALAADVLALMDHLKLESVSLVGHSMGGKTAMWLALSQPERVDRLVVGDIAPVSYPNRFEQIFLGLQELPLEDLQSREAADQYLARRVSDRAVRQFLLQNLVKGPTGWSWRFALPVLQKSLPQLAGFPHAREMSFAGKTLFIYGERSDYVTPAYRDAIERYFPHARLRMLNGVGHWLYAEQPEAFAQVVKGFLF